MIFPVYRRSEPDTLEPRTPSRSSPSTLPRSTLLQRDVAEQLRVGTTSIRNWERNLSQPSVAYMPGIIKFLAYNPLSPSDRWSDASCKAAGPSGSRSALLPARWEWI
jgi:hypothetical protein